MSKETETEEKEKHCPDCGGKSHKRGKKSKQVIGSQGEIEIEPIIFVSSAKKVFPLDRKWALNASAYTLEMGRQMTWLSGLLPFEQCQRFFWSWENGSFRAVISGDKVSIMVKNSGASPKERLNKSVTLQ